MGEGVAPWVAGYQLGDRGNCTAAVATKRIYGVFWGHILPYGIEYLDVYSGYHLFNIGGGRSKAVSLTLPRTGPCHRLTTSSPSLGLLYDLAPPTYSIARGRHPREGTLLA